MVTTPTRTGIVKEQKEKDGQNETERESEKGKDVGAGNEKQKADIHKSKLASSDPPRRGRDQAVAVPESV